DQRVDREVLLPLRRQIERRVASDARNGHKSGDERRVRQHRLSQTGKPLLKLLESDRGAVFGLEARGALDVADDRVEWAVGVMRRALPADGDVLVPRDVVDQSEAHS